MRHGVLAVVAAGVLLNACDVDPTAVGTTATGGALSSQAVQDQAPVIGEMVAKPDGSGNFLLAVKATDPQNTALSYSWSVDGGSLSTRTGPSTLWRPPQLAGSFSAVVTVANGKGLKRSATQQFSVAADGQAQSTGIAQVSTAAAQSVGTGSITTPVAGSTATTLPVLSDGRFAIPSPVPFAAASPVIVAGASALPAVTPGPAASLAPFEQPVATPIPGPTPTPIPGQPIATPTPTPTPTPPLPSALPTAVPPTPAPGVPVPPTSVWVQVNPALVPTSEQLHALSFPFDATGTFNEGWAVGGNSVVLHTGNSGQSWDQRSSGLPSGVALSSVAFTAGAAGTLTGGGFTEAGFAAGSNRVFRTTDYGGNWGEITPPGLNTAVKQLVVYNSRQVLVVTDDGQVIRTDNGNASTPGGVTWVPVDTKPIARVGDQVSNLCSGTAFPNSDMTLGWFVGDSIYRYDSDATNDWTRVVQFQPNDRPVSSVAASSVNDIWVGSNAGVFYHSPDSGQTWGKIATINNREHNGVKFTLTPGAIIEMDAPDSQNVFALNSLNVYDTKNGGASWKETRLPQQLFDFQIEAQVVNGNRQFIGWGCGPNGVILRYIPAQ